MGDPWLLAAAVLVLLALAGAFSAAEVAVLSARPGRIEALLADSGIAVLVLDQHTSVLEGSAGAIPRRVMVADEDYARARNVLENAGEGAELGR